MASLRQIKPPPPPSPREWTLLESVRKRPAMYFGSTDAWGLSHCFWEIVSNAVDQHLAGRLRALSVSFDEAGSVEVVDDGLGIPVARDEHGVALLERICCELHRGPTLDGHLPHIHLAASVLGSGLASTAAAAAHFEIETVCEGRRARLVMERGAKVGEVLESDTSRASGTRVCFHPDPTIFGNTQFDRIAIRDRMEAITWWLPGLRVRWQDEELPGLGGAAGWLRALGVTGPVLATRVPVANVGVDVALGYAETPVTDVRTFVNLHPTVEGTHERGLFDALVAVARVQGAREPRQELERRLAVGLVARVQVWLTAPEFGGPTKAQLRTPVARAAVAEAIVNAIVHAGTEGAFLRQLKERVGIS